MLGSAISKRWVVSLALVGLVSLFMASFSAVWANPASATTGTTAPADTATPTPTEVPANDTIAGMWFGQGPPNASTTFSDVNGPSPDLALSSAAVGGSADSRLWFAAVNSDRSWIDQAPAASFNATSSNSGCVAISGLGFFGSNSGIGVFDVSAVAAGCNATITVYFMQGSNTIQDDFVVTVNALPSTAVPTVVPVEPVATPVPPSGVTGDAVKTISPVTGGKLEVDTTIGKIELDVPAGALGSGEGASVSVEPVNNTGTLPPPPPPATEGSSSGTFKFGSSVIQITWYDDKGDAEDTKTLNRSAQVCMTATQADVDNAHGGESGLGVWRHNGTEWVKLNSSVVNNGDGTWKVCAYTSRFSPFALGLEVEPPATSEAGTGLPATGGYSPNGLTILMAMAAGFALVGTGVVTARRARRVREDS